ncbi:MAG: hypothetical protein WCO08_07580 [Actinomycetes bacterium]
MNGKLSQTLDLVLKKQVRIELWAKSFAHRSVVSRARAAFVESDRGDVPGWVLVVLMTTGLITGIWTVAAPRLSSILTHSLDNMNNIR